MMVWTFQPHGLIPREISAHGSYHALRARSSWHDDAMFMNAYSWMVGAMNAHHVMKPRSLRNDASAAPIWCYARWRMPDGMLLGTESDLPAIRRADDFDWADDMDLIALNLPLRRMLLTDFDDWNMPLNGLPFMSDDEWKQYERDGYPEVDPVSMRATWEHVIVPPHDISHHDYMQATIWEIRKDDIMAIIPPSSIISSV